MVTDSTATFELKISPHWLPKLFGAKPAVLNIADGKVSVSVNGSQSVAVELNDFDLSKVVKKGIFFSSVNIKTVHGNIQLKGLTHDTANEFFVWLRAQWLVQIAPSIRKVDEAVRRILGRGYPRTSRIEKAQAYVRKAYSTFKVLPEADWNDQPDSASFKLLADIANKDSDGWRQFQNRYVAKQLKAYRDFFDTVESQPLTDKQREACIVDEDNNLVLAGAGTGKTSVMVGRAGYLLESKQAKPEQILMLAFANKAAAEMQERIENRLGHTHITASTFHKLGKNIIAKVEGEQPSLSPLAEDDTLLAWHINNWHAQHLEEPAYKKLTLDYFEKYLYPEANPFDFESEGAYFDFILANDIRTLKGELVKSLGECLIANHLFKLGIEYEYEAAYEHHTATVLHRQYQPDFYLPEHGIYIEYFGIDRNRNTAPYIDRDKYHEGMEWKRSLHQQHQTQLIELFHYQNLEGTLLTSIEEQLTSLNAEFEPLPEDAVLNTLREFGAINHFAILLKDLLKRYRANCFEPAQLERTIQAAPNQNQVRAAIGLLTPILKDYQAFLDAQGYIDFDDMINKALKYVEMGQFKSPWRFILVDEFQDISDPRARLVKALRDSAPDSSLFCVGDDWQAIYRFTGSDLTFTTQFEQVFGTTAITPLDLTFRFNSAIGEVATQFVLQNPNQIKKELKSNRVERRPTVSLMRADNNDQKPDAESRTARVLRRISSIAEPNSKVYFLSRFGFYLPDLHMLKMFRAQYPALNIEAMTIHTSKGKEADYVVVLGLEAGKHGFPSEKVTHPLLEALLPPLEAYKHAEERRLFYVALTRAKQRAYLVADMAVASDFVVELLKNDYKIELNEFEASLAQQLFHLLKCVKCKTGTLVSRQSQFGKFFGCNKYPLCSHKERGCAQCGSPMTRVDRFKVCVNSECRHWVPICPKCGAELTLRKGKYGEFWGCRNYRQEGDACRHTENSIIFDKDKILKELEKHIETATSNAE
ncbi:DNA helicase IV [Nitrincola lacisaponensis]|uniref:DNA 3'-5' helicase n=1 Tax=Nitrincola lacisaponensis TaxID=267850 RepID=A0A063Y2D3_9GAMM|nr:UvrD-helicase domain-containing protein [Nitrincola lacisaponensis]KDE39839.1 DNA helicase IV [Nitrincola lacisaponensis]